MARTHASGDVPSRVTLAYSTPFTVSLWFYPTDTTTAVQTMFTQQNSNNVQYFKIYLVGATGTVYVVDTDGLATGFNPCLVAGVNFNAWNHIYATFGVSTLFGALNGTTTDTGNAVNGTTDRIRLGAAQLTSIPVTYGEYFAGRIAEVAIWDDDVEAAYPETYKRLYAKMSPLRTMSTSLTSARYWPFIGDGDDLFQKTAFTVGGNGYSDHVPMMSRKAPQTPLRIG